MRADALWRRIGEVEQRLGQSLERLFPLRDGLQPMDVVAAVERAVSDPRNRAPWRGGKTYAPNRYTVHVVCRDSRQRDFLFAFVSDQELVRIVQQQAEQEQYRFLSDPQFTLQTYDEAIPGHDDATVWVESGWAAPDVDEHEQATEPPVRARLVVEEGPDRGTEMLVRDPVIHIGRSRRAGNALVLSDPHVSRRHVRLEVGSDGRITLENLRSEENPVSVNGQPAAQAVLSFGDRLRLGSTVLVVVPPEGTSAAGPPAAE